jgi:hypothetical protein
MEISMKDELLEDLDNVKLLSDALSRCPEVSKHDRPQRPEGSEIASGLAEVESASREFACKSLPELVRAAKENGDLLGPLMDVAEELRRIDWVIHSTRFFSWLWPLVEDAENEARSGTVAAKSRIHKRRLR